MKKQVFGRHFSRTKNQRQALFRGLIGALIDKGEIVTTLPKAKAIKSQAEKLITKAKRGSLTDKRVILRFLPQRALVNRLVFSIAPLFKEKKGGYLRIVRLNRRRGDAAQMAKLSFTEELPTGLPIKQAGSKGLDKIGNKPEKVVEKEDKKETKKAKKTEKKIK